MEPLSSPSHPLTTTTLSTPQLSTSPHLPALYNLINTAFEHSHRTGHRTVLLTERRLQIPTQLLEELGPNGFCILAFEASEPHDPNDDSNNEKPGKLIATASAKPYTPGSTEPAEAGSLVSEINKLFKQTRGVEGKSAVQPPVLPKLNSSSLFPEEDGKEAEEGIPTWEILTMGVDPALQGRGIASWMLGFTIEEIKKRLDQARKEKQEEEEVVGKEEWKGQKVKILLSTMKELNEGYYQRKGWKTTAERRFEAGVGGSEEGFGIVDMVRVVGG